MFTTGLPEEEIAISEGKSNLKEKTWEGKVTPNAFYAVDYQVTNHKAKK